MSEQGKMTKRAIDVVIEDLMATLAADDMPHRLGFGGKTIFTEAVHFYIRVYPEGPNGRSFDEAVFEDEMAKIKPWPDTSGEMQGVADARNKLTHWRLLAADFVDATRQRCAGGRRRKYYNVNGSELKQNKPTWEKPVNGTPLEFDAARLYFENVLCHLPRHLDKLRDEVQLPPAKKQKTEPAPVTKNLDAVPLAIESPPLPLFEVKQYDVKSEDRELEEAVRESSLRRVDSGGGASAEPQEPKNEHRFKVGDIVRRRPLYQYTEFWTRSFAVTRVYRDDNGARIFDMESSLDKGSKVYLAQRQIIYQPVAGS
jgi:hypothetical protein